MKQIKQDILFNTSEPLVPVERERERERVTDS